MASPPTGTLTFLFTDIEGSTSRWEDDAPAMQEAGDLVLEPARRELRLRSQSPSRDLVEIGEATLGAKSGMLGAAALARDEDEEYLLGVSAPR